MPKASTQGRLLAVLAAGVLVAACSGNPEPTVESKSPKPKASTRSASPTPTPPSPSATPGEAPERTFVRHYFELRNFARQTGNVKPMQAVSSSKCQSCKGAADVISKVFTAGGHYEGGYKWKIEWIEGKGTRLLVGTTTGAFQVTSSSGAKPTSNKPAKIIYDITLEQKGDQWMMRELAVQR